MRKLNTSISFFKIIFGSFLSLKSWNAFETVEIWIKILGELHTVMDVITLISGYA